MFEYADYHSLFTDYGMTAEAVGRLIRGWQETHRYYHTETHLAFLVAEIEKMAQSGVITPPERHTLLMTAFFHDVIYDPTATDNEAQSAALFAALTQPRPDTGQIQKIILDTRTHQPSTPLSAAFIGLDLAILTQSALPELLTYETQIRLEYQFADYGIYKSLRLAFLENFIRQHPQNQTNIQALMDWLRHYRPAVGVYAGSFNPFHNGHLNILEKAERIFDKVIVARGINPEKAKTEGIADFTNLHILKYRQKEDFAGLLTTYLSQKEEHCQVTLIRGLRNGDDLDYEVNQLRFMEEMKPDIRVVFIRCDKQFEHISSSAIRNLEQITAGLGNKYLPKG